MKIIVYSKPMCGACDLLKSFLRKEMVDFEEVDGSTAAGLTRMRVEGIFPAYYPVLQVDDRIYEYGALFGEHGELLDIRELIA